MAGNEPPTKRIRYDFTTTFDVIVGNAQGRERRFPVYQDLLTARSNFLLAARIAEPQRPVCLEHEDPDVFSLYLNCVHSGMEVVRAGGELLGKRFHAALDSAGILVKRERDSEESAEEIEDNLDKGRFEALIRLHMLARTLQDPEMMNSTISELIRMVDEDGLIPTQVNLVYSSTSRGDVLRTLVRDVYIHEAESSECHEFLQTSELHSDFWRDVSLEYFRLKDTEKSVGDVYGLKIGRDKGMSRCDYHQRLPDEQVELPHTASATATAIRTENHAPAVLQASGHSDHPSVAATAATGTVQERAPLPPQNSARSSSTAAAVTYTVHADERAPSPPQARARSGRPLGTGYKVQRRPTTQDVWWTVSQERFDSAGRRDVDRYTNVGNAMELGVPLPQPCSRCMRKGQAAHCKAGASGVRGRCGPCLWDKASIGDGC